MTIFEKSQSIFQTSPRSKFAWLFQESCEPQFESSISHQLSCQVSRKESFFVIGLTLTLLLDSTTVVLGHKKVESSSKRITIQSTIGISCYIDIATGIGCN